MNYTPNHQSIFRRVVWAQMLLLRIPNVKSHQPHLAFAEHREQLCPQFHLPLCSSVTQHKLPSCAGAVQSLSHLPASRNTVCRCVIWEPKARVHTMHFLHPITTLLLACSA